MNKSALNTAVIFALRSVLSDGNKKATVYLDTASVVTVTARFKPYRGQGSRDFVLTIGRPNFASRRYIRLCKKRGEPLRMQTKDWPAKKPAKRKRRNEWTSARVASDAARVLQDAKSSKLERRIAASALTQANNKKKGKK